MMKLMLLTGDPEFAKKAQDCGIDRIFLDLEYINKAERQMGRNTYISPYSVENIAPLRRVLDCAQLLVRVNPINPHSQEEIDRAIAEGADIVMLPMVFDADDASHFVRIVHGRAKTCPMIETAQSMARLDEILDVSGIDELFIGLNDLHISMGLSFMFELLSGGLVEYMAEKITAKGIPFGFGGMAKIGEGLLPAERILAEHYRLGSSSVILSRTFRNEIDADGKKILDLPAEILKIRSEEDRIRTFTPADFETNAAEVKRCVKEIRNNIRI
jgi:hypothetical protein